LLVSRWENENEMRSSPNSKPSKRPIRPLDPKSADELRQTVTQILKKLRAGHSVRIPGLGNLVPGKKTRFVGPGETAHAKTEIPAKDRKS